MWLFGNTNVPIRSHIHKCYAGKKKMEKYNKYLNIQAA